MELDLACPWIRRGKDFGRVVQHDEQRSCCTIIRSVAISMVGASDSIFDLRCKDLVLKFLG